MIRTETWMSCKWMTTQFLCGSPNDGQHLEYRYNTVNNKNFQNDTGNWGLSSSIAGLIKWKNKKKLGDPHTFMGWSWLSVTSSPGVIIKCKTMGNIRSQYGRDKVVERSRIDPSWYPSGLFNIDERRKSNSWLRHRIHQDQDL